MADITKIITFRHLRAAPTAHVRHLRRGRLVHDGPGLAFWFSPLSAAISEVPIDDRELPLMFHAYTADFQDVSVQATVSYRVADPGAAATRIDFGVNPYSGRWRATPLEQLGGIITKTAQQHALDLVAGMPLAEALTAIPAVRARVAEGLAADPRLAETGLVVLGVRVVAIRPEPEVEKALQTPTREVVQQDADRATYERRAIAVENERAIAENELRNQIELARREEQLVAQRGANARRQAEESAAADAIEARAQGDREGRLARVRAEATRVLGEAKGTAEAARLAPYRDLRHNTLMGLAAQEAASHLPQIGSLVLTPDLLAGALAQLSQRRTADGGPRTEDGT